jgi:hypothetical protein
LEVIKLVVKVRNHEGVAFIVLAVFGPYVAEIPLNGHGLHRAISLKFYRLLSPISLGIGDEQQSEGIRK